jgi:hypothetical protein
MVFGKSSTTAPASASMSKPFAGIPRRWIVERTFGWLMRHRRLARDYETQPHRSEAMIRLALIYLISRRLTHESTSPGQNAEAVTDDLRSGGALLLPACAFP